MYGKYLENPDLIEYDHSACIKSKESNPDEFDKIIEHVAEYVSSLKIV